MSQKVILCVLTFFMIVWSNPYINKKTQRNTPQALKDFDSMKLLQGCVRNDVASCEVLLGRGVIDVQQCEPYDCALIGALFSYANREKEALPYLERSCNSEENKGCTHLALIYERLGHYTESVMYYKRACDLFDKVACYNLAMQYYNAKNLHANFDSIIKILKQSCDMFYSKACYNLAVLQANERQEFMVARFYFDKSCDLGMQEGCEQAAYLKKLGINMPPLQKRSELIQ